MTVISRDDVLHLAQLSGLQLGAAEIDVLQTDIGNILGYIDQLGELDTDGVAPTYQVTGLQNVWRDDVVVQDGVSRDTLLAASPDHHAGAVKVPKVL